MKFAIIAILLVLGSISAQVSKPEVCIGNLKKGVKLLLTIADDLDKDSKFRLMADFMSGAALLVKTQDSCLKMTSEDVITYGAEKLTSEQRKCLVQVLHFVNAAKDQLVALKNKKFADFFSKVPSLLSVTKKAGKICPSSILN